MCEPESQRQQVDKGDHSCPEPRFRDADSGRREGSVDQKPEAGAASSCHGWCCWTTRAAAWRLWHSARTFLQSSSTDEFSSLKRTEEKYREEEVW